MKNNRNDQHNNQLFDLLHDEIRKIMQSAVANKESKITTANFTAVALSALLCWTETLMKAVHKADTKESNGDSGSLYQYYTRAIAQLADRLKAGKESTPAEDVVKVVFGISNHDQIAKSVAGFFKCSEDDAKEFLVSKSGCYSSLNKDDEIWLSGLTIFELLKHLSKTQKG